MKVYSAAGLPVPLKYRQDWCQPIRAHLSGTGKDFSAQVADIVDYQPHGTKKFLQCTCPPILSEAKIGLSFKFYK